MAPWVWFLNAGRHVFLHADARLAGSDIRIDPLRGVLAAADQAPSSTYRGEVCFFDSIEHRDMFEANHHRPVAIDSVLVATHEQHGRRLQRQGAR